MIGVYYYPEQWPEAQWERDIQNIHDMGMKHIHMAEFSWIHLEPEQGHYDFSWLDKAISIAQKYELKIILCTPTATPPIWMSHTYPDTLMVKENDQRVTHGSRAHRCVNSSRFNNFAKIITQKLGERYGSNTDIIGWQLDNEIGHYGSLCYCDACLEAFKDYLKKKYQTIEVLNNAWAGDFWSQNHQDFSQIQFPNPQTLPYIPNEHALLDFKQFFSISLSRFLERQSMSLRPLIHKNAWITHNFMKDDPIHYPGHIQQNLVQRTLDLYALTIYPVAGQFKGKSQTEHHRIGDPINIACNHDQMRSYNGRWGILEQQPGQVNWGPCNLRPWPGSTRLWLWTALAHGAELLSTYRFRQPLSGAEQYHEGLMGLDGITLTQGGKDFKQVAQELEKLSPYFEQSHNYPQKNAAIFMDWNSLTAMSIHPQSVNFDPYECWIKYYGALKRLGLHVDILNSNQAHDLSQYDVVCTGLYDLLDDSTIDAWKQYTDNGGHLIITLRTATRNINGHFPEIPYGQRIFELTGTRISGYDVMPDNHTGAIELTRSNQNITWQTWAEQYEPGQDSNILATFSDQFYKDSCAAFKTRRAKGSITCLGFDEKKGIEQLMHESLSEEFEDLNPLPPHTLFTTKGCLGFFLNYDDQPHLVPESLYQHGKILLGDKITQPCDLTIIKM